eukprot:3050264-Pleurochrysis_carterae.AAC.2
MCSRCRRRCMRSCSCVGCSRAPAPLSPPFPLPSTLVLPRDCEENVESGLPERPNALSCSASSWLVSSCKPRARLKARNVDGDLRGHGLRCVSPVRAPLPPPPVTSSTQGATGELSPAKPTAVANGASAGDSAHARPEGPAEADARAAHAASTTARPATPRPFLRSSHPPPPPNPHLQLSQGSAARCVGWHESALRAPSSVGVGACELRSRLETSVCACKRVHSGIESSLRMRIRLQCLRRVESLLTHTFLGGVKCHACVG